jgi:hypothetical protein
MGLSWGGSGLASYQELANRRLLFLASRFAVRD